MTTTTTRPNGLGCPEWCSETHAENSPGIERVHRHRVSRDGAPFLVEAQAWPEAADTFGVPTVYVDAGQDGDFTPRQAREFAAALIAAADALDNIAGNTGTETDNANRTN